MKQKTLGQVAWEAWSSVPWDRVRGGTKLEIKLHTSAVVREHEKRKGVCVWHRKSMRKWCWKSECKYIPKWMNMEMPIEYKMRYCPKCGKRIKVTNENPPS